MLNKILYNMGLFNHFYEEDFNLMEIKNKLKPTITLTRKFYVPTEQEIMNKYQMIENRKKPKINIEELINIKKNLTHI